MKQADSRNPISDKIADVSVIIPVYNSGEEAYRAVSSVAAQTLLPREVFLIDDASPKKEETRAWLTKIEKDFGEVLSITVLYQRKNGGAGEARNAGWDRAKRKYIAFLDSDDIWHPKKLEIQYDFMEAHPDIGFSCHHMKTISEEEIAHFSEEEIPDAQKHIVLINPVRYLFKHYPKGGTPSVMIRNRKDVRFFLGKRYSEDVIIWWIYCFRYGGALLDLYMAASFKSFYGASGLSGSLWPLEKSELENYGILHREGLISLPLFLAARSFSFLKFLRRVLICAMR